MMSVSPHPRGTAVNVAHPPVHTVSVSAMMSGLTGQPVASHCAEMGRTQIESQSSRMPARKSNWMRQLPSISVSSARGRMKASVKLPWQLMLAAAAVSMGQALPSAPVATMEAQSMRLHSMGASRSRDSAVKGQDPGADRLAAGGSGGGGFADHARWNPWGWALASETKWTVRLPVVVKVGGEDRLPYSVSSTGEAVVGPSYRTR